MACKTLGNPKQTLLISNDTIEAIYEISVTFGNLVKTEYGLYFHQIWVVTQTNYDVDESQDGAGVSRIKLRVSTSNGELKGIQHVPSITKIDYIRSTIRIRPSWVNDKLIFEAHFTDYSNYFAKGGGFTLGDLYRESKCVAYDLPPKTLEKSSIISEEKDKIITEK